MLSVVIPAYNEEKTVKSVVEQVGQALKGREHEIIVVDDGSTDRTAERCPGAKVIRHPYNKGYGASLKTGALNAAGDWVLYIDADGQHDARDILKLLAHQGEYDMVVGQRTESTSFLRSPAKLFLTHFANYLTESRILDLNSGFRLIRKKLVLKYMSILPEKFSFTTTITMAAFRGGYSVKYVPITIKRRSAGNSTIHPLKDTVRFGMLILRMTMLFSPLRVFLPIALALFLTGSGLIAYEIFVYSNIGTVSVMMILASIIVFLFGLLSDQVVLLRKDDV
jgi:glycosyltransferase involved in cell wall biosynthesis